eukprot:7805853-Pyramimonas_sp.AAC.1
MSYCLPASCNLGFGGMSGTGSTRGPASSGLSPETPQSKLQAIGGDSDEDFVVGDGGIYGRWGPPAATEVLGARIEKQFDQTRNQMKEIRGA